MYLNIKQFLPFLALVTGFIQAPLLYAYEENSGGSPRGWVRWYDMPSDGSTVISGQDLGDVRAKSDYDIWGHASCGRDAYVRVSGSCYLTNSDSSTGDSDGGGCGDAETRQVNVLMRAGNYYSNPADIPTCWVEGEWNADSGTYKYSRTYQLGSVFEWISFPSGGYAIGYGSQSADARLTTADSNTSTRIDIATTSETNMRFFSDTPTICTVKEWGEITGIDAGTCTIRATSDVVGIFGSVSQTKSFTYYWPDSDNDGVLDNADNCPSVHNADQSDVDGSGIGDACNDDRDPDGDDYELSRDNCITVNNPSQQDTDSNGVGDACNDGLDLDGDEWENRNDNCPSVYNPAQTPSPTIAGLGDACDEDSDTDGVLDGNDNCPLVQNPTQIDSNADGVGDACAADTDSDNVDDRLDNCPSIANTNQSDFDNDGFGDACELDSDNDGVADDSGLETDNCPLVANSDQADSDKNGIGDVCEMVFVMPVQQGSGDCLSWANACADIGVAIGVANGSGRNQVFVAQGVYNVASTIDLAAGISIYGGFEGDELRATSAAPSQNLTILSADPGGDVLTDSIVETVGDKLGNNNLSRLLSANNLGTSNGDSITVSGFIFNAAGSSSVVDGSVAYINNSKVSFISNELVANESAKGAIYASGGADVEFIGIKARNNRSVTGAVVAAEGVGTTVEINNSEFTANTATGDGGVMYINAADVMVNNSTIDGNAASMGGAFRVINNNSILLVEDSELKNNTASSTGGAISIGNSNVVTIYNSELTGNAATSGAAVAFAGGSTKLTINSSSFIENYAQTNGGAVSGSNANTVDILNSTFAYNRAGADDNGDNLSKVQARGGALNFGLLQVPVDLTHSTFVGNESLGTSFGGGAISIDNTSTQGITLFANLIVGNYAASGGNLAVVSAGTATATQKFVDTGYNLIGFNNAAGVEPTDSIDFGGSTSFVAVTEMLDELVETVPNRKGGDGYWPDVNMLPIVGGGEARDAIPDIDCTAVSIDARGELRPDEKNNACDIGAYEFTVLSCQEDAARRYEQGETFVKSCDADLEGFELNLGVLHYNLLVILAGLLCFRFRRVSK